MPFCVFGVGSSLIQSYFYMCRILLKRLWRKGDVPQRSPTLGPLLVQLWKSSRRRGPKSQKCVMLLEKLLSGVYSHERLIETRIEMLYNIQTWIFTESMNFDWISVKLRKGLRKLRTRRRPRRQKCWPSHRRLQVRVTLPRVLHPRVQSLAVAAGSVDHIFWFVLVFKLASLLDRTCVNLEYFTCYEKLSVLID